MQYAGRYIQTAGKIVGSYDGSVPFHHFLKQYFSSEKKYGSKDRKAIAHACYCCFRLGKALSHLQTEERIKAGLFLCDATPTRWQQAIDPAWLDHWGDDLQHRISFLEKKTGLAVADIFPLNAQISDAIDKPSFIVSHLVQPDLYLRIRPGKKEKVNAALSAAGISFTSCSDNCIALPNTTKADQLLALNQDAVVQDRSSQRIAGILLQAGLPPGARVWDCCAASGGKSILACDVLKNIDLSVSDVRPSIIHNLEKRFAVAGIKRYRSFIADLSAANHRSADKYDLVICDAPCSGSGTWGRTPEQLVYFDKGRIDHYAALQQKIVDNVVPSLERNGYLLYITCSVFTKENETMVEYIKTHHSLHLQEMAYLKGYDSKADTMFAALFTASKP